MPLWDLGDGLIVLVKINKVRIINGSDKAGIFKFHVLVFALNQILGGKINKVFTSVTCYRFGFPYNVLCWILSSGVEGHYEKVRHVSLLEEVVDASVYGDHVVDAAACKHCGKDDKQQQNGVHDLFSLQIFFENSEKQFCVLPFFGVEHTVNQNLLNNP